MLIYPVVLYILPFRLNLPDGIYDVVLAGHTHRIQVKLIANRPTAHAPLVWEERFEVAHDIWGRTGNSEFYVVVNEPVSESTLEKVLQNHAISDPDQEFLDVWEAKQASLLDDAIKIGNRLLEVYRDQDINLIGETSFHIMSLTEEDLSAVQLLLLDENHDVRYRFVRPYGGIMTFTDRSETVVQTIRDFLKNEMPIPVSRILTRKAEHSLWRGDYRLVPVEINTVFEITVETVLDDYITLYPVTKRPELLKEKLEVIQKLSNAYRKSIDKPEMHWITSKNWEELKRFKGAHGYRQEIINWLIDCYQLRNATVHLGSLTVTKAEAETAMDSAKKAIVFLQTLREIEGN